MLLDDARRFQFGWNSPVSPWDKPLVSSNLCLYKHVCAFVMYPVAPHKNIDESLQRGDGRALVGKGRDPLLEVGSNKRWFSRRPHAHRLTHERISNSQHDINTSSNRSEVCDFYFIRHVSPRNSIIGVRCIPVCVLPSEPPAAPISL